MKILNNTSIDILNQMKSTYNQGVKDNTIEQKSLTHQSKEQYDRLEISEEGLALAGSQNLGVTTEIIIEKPREWTIVGETAEAFTKHINETLEKREHLNLSYYDGLKFMKDEGEKWVENLRTNDTEMFVQWLKSNKDDIEAGRPDLASLPSNFTMKDYYSYVGNE